MSAVVHLGDCIGQAGPLREGADPASFFGLQVLEDDSVDVTLTDPPYEDEAHTKGKRQGPTRDSRVRVVDEEFPFHPIEQWQRDAVGAEIGRVTRRLAAVFCQVEASMLWRSALEAGGLIYRRTIPWVKPDAMPSLHGRWPGQAFEAIVLAMKPGATAPIGGKARYYEVTRERRRARAHPTAKPVELMRQMVEDLTDVGDLVLDPFAGSGTTGIACVMLGRRFIGWEAMPEFHAIASRRLAGREAQPRAEQPSLFDGARP